MSNFEVSDPILNSLFEEPEEHVFKMATGSGKSTITACSPWSILNKFADCPDSRFSVA